MRREKNEDRCVTHRQLLINALHLAVECVKAVDLSQETFQSVLHLVHAVQDGVKVIGLLGDASHSALDSFQQSAKTSKNKQEFFV